MAPHSTLEERLLVFSPRGRDAQVIGTVLAREGFDCVAVPGFDEFAAAIEAGAGAAIVAEEALHGIDTSRLMAWLERQEPWSDFPFVLLVARMGEPPAGPARPRHAGLGNMIMLERPLNAQTLCSAAASALRGRRRQYQARDVLADRVRTAQRLRESQRDLVQLNETLELRIAERTRALAQANDRLMNEVIERERVQQALVQFQKMEAIGRLTGGIAHDFNNLLNVVQGSLDLILMMSTDEATRKRAEVAQRACQRGGKLTGQLLAFSRHQSLDLRPVKVQALFDGVRELVAASLGAGIALRFEVDGRVDSIVADANQMEMALLNLAINACDAMPHGGQLVFTAAAAAPPDSLPREGGYVRIAVTDTGEGMSADVAARVFEPFFTTKGVGKGTGLGLSQVYGMAQQSGGVARIVSEPGAGTTVEIWLRAATGTGDTLARTAPSARRPAPGSGSRILVVEDDDFVRVSMVESLEALGYRVTQAADGEAGLRELRRECPDLMITDYLMPGITGADLIERARRDFPGLPMIIATGYADMRAIEQVIGDDVVLRKPFQLPELAASVERALLKAAQRAKDDLPAAEPGDHAARQAMLRTSAHSREPAR